MTSVDSILTLRRVIAVPRETVFDAWTRPETVRRWWGGWPDDSAPDMTVQLEVGGEYRFAMPMENGTQWVTGRYTEIDRPSKLVFTFRWEGQDGPETPVILEFHDAGDGRTELVLTHDIQLNANACVEGWTWAFDNLEACITA